MTWAECMEVYEAWKKFYNDETLSAKEQNAKFLYWAAQQDYSAQQMEIVKEEFKYWQMLPAEGTSEATIDEILGAGLSEKKTYEALASAMGENLYDKLTEAVAAGIPCATFVGFWNDTKDLQGDPDPENPEQTISGSKKRKVVEAIDRLNLTVAQKDALYRIQGYEESGLYDTPWH